MKKTYFVLILILLFSGSLFSQSIQVLNPLNLCKGDPFTIKWTKSGLMNANVKIKLFKADLSSNTTITISTPNDGSYSWIVPVSVPDGDYRLRVKTIDNAVWDDSAPFNISGCSSVCKINISDPCPEGSTVTLWEKKSTPIHWNPSFNPGGNVRINMTYANCPGESGPVLLILYTLAASTPNDGSFTFTTPDVKVKKCYKISINKIGTKCFGRSGIIQVRPKLENYNKIR